MAVSDVQAVRSLSGLSAADVDDAEVGRLLELTGSPQAAAAEALDVHATRLVDVTDPEGLSVRETGRAKAMVARAAALRAQAAAAADDGFVFEVVDRAPSRAELAERGW